MGRYAIVRDDIIENIIVADDTFKIDGVSLVEDKNGKACIGLKYKDGIFEQPESLPEPNPPRLSVAKSIVMQRLIDLNKIDEAYSMLVAKPAYFGRWFAPDRPEIYCDDPDSVGFVLALNLDPAVILAPKI